MPIDTLTQLGAASVKPPEAKSINVKGAPDVSAPRQELPVTGKSLPAGKTGESAKGPQLELAVSNINDYVQNINRSLQFSIDDGSGRTIVKVVDSETGNLIRQIPSEEILAISKAIEENYGEDGGIIISDQV